MRRLLVVIGMACSMVAGCSVGPDYKKPEVTMPQHYAAETATTQPSAQVNELRRWWTTFEDPTLESLIARATQNNLDLRLASARVIESRAARGVAVAGLFPNLNGNASYTRSSASNNAFRGGGGGAGSINGNSFGQSRESDLYEAGFDSTWEIDIFGGVRREVEAANADIQAAVEGQRDVLVTLLGDVARNYMSLRGSQRRLELTRANLVSQRETLDVTQARFRAGIVGELDVARSRALAESTAAQIPALQAATEQSIHRLGVLLGEDPESLYQELGPQGKIPVGVSQLPTDMPSELLRRRPDIRRAERQLAAQTARIGVATADLFPRFSLTGAFGVRSTRYGNLFEGDSIFWNVGPAIKWNLFSAGAVQANIDVQNAVQQQALVTYQQTILNSLEEVENAMVSFVHEQDRRVSLAASAESYRRAVQLANDLYSRGLTDYLSVQEAQRNLLTAEDQLAQSETAVSSDLVAVYKALGGGWETFEEDSSQSSAR